MNLNRIIHGDTLDVMADLEPASFAAIVTSPPYNLKLSASYVRRQSSMWQMPPLAGGYEGHDDDMDDSAYVAWQRECLTAMLRLLKPGGGIWYNHCWKTQDGLLNSRQSLVEGFPVRQVIIWARLGGYNFTRSYFCPTYEVIYLITGPDWRLPEGKTGYGNVWRMATNNGEDGILHPAPFPLALPYRAIECTSIPGPVLDPFMGSGTTGMAAVRHGREWLGIEQSATYIAEAEERIRLEVCQPPML